MLDATLRPLINPPLNFLGRVFSKLISAQTATFLGFGFGLVSIIAITLGWFNMAAGFLVLNRLMDGLDGAIAREEGVTDFGGFLDIVCDFIIYAGVPLAFALYEPTQAIFAAFLIFAFIGTITSFLAYAILAAKRQVNTDVRGKKSFYHLGGLCEGTETFAALLLMCLMPSWFPVIAVTYGMMCLITTVFRILQSKKDFGSSA